MFEVPGTRGLRLPEPEAALPHPTRAPFLVAVEFLSARGTQILSRVLGRGVALAAIGVALGVAVSLAVTRMMGSFLIGISAGDPATFVAVALGLIGVATIASLIPALRASHVDPVRALRSD